MPGKSEGAFRTATEADLAVGLICADQDGNRIRIDHVNIDRANMDRANQDTGSISYHFLNDELRVQEGVQELSLEKFLAQGWYIAASGKSL